MAAAGTDAAAGAAALGTIKSKRTSSGSSTEYEEDELVDEEDADIVEVGAVARRAGMPAGRPPVAAAVVVVATVMVLAAAAGAAAAGAVVGGRLRETRFAASGTVAATEVFSSGVESAPVNERLRAVAAEGAATTLVGGCDAATASAR